MGIYSLIFPSIPGAMYVVLCCGRGMGIMRSGGVLLNVVGVGA